VVAVVETTLDLVDRETGGARALAVLEEVAFGGREEEEEEGGGGAGSPSRRASREGRSGVASDGFVIEWRIESEGERDGGAIPARRKGRKE